jgi:hypothetical protein
MHTHPISSDEVPHDDANISPSTSRRTRLAAGPFLTALPVAARFCLGLAAPAVRGRACATGTVNRPSPSEQNVYAIKPAEKCLSGLRAFDGQMEQDDYWLGGPGYGERLPDGRTDSAMGTATRSAATRPNATGYGTCGRATRSGPSLPPPTFSPDTANSRRVGRDRHDPRYLQTLRG